MAPTRWGILGTGRISFDFAHAISLLPQEDHTVAAIGARKLSSAGKFAEQFNIPKAYGSYKELADDPDLDVVYVGTIHLTHFDICKLLIGVGKNVLCEKPMMMNTDQAKIILDMAKEKNVFFMEGIWSRFFPVYNKLKEVLNSGVIGHVKFVKVGFGFDIMHVPRFVDKTLGGGATLDLGCYTVQLVQMIFKEYPHKIVSSGILAETGVDEATFTTLHYSNNRIAQVHCHAGVNMSNVAEIYGTKGTVMIPHFWSPVSMVIAGEKHEFPLPSAKLPTNLPHSQGLIYEAESVRQCLLKGEKENPLMTHKDSLWNMSILTEILKQNGFNYDV